MPVEPRICSVNNTCVNLVNESKVLFVHSRCERERERESGREKERERERKREHVNRYER